MEHQSMSDQSPPNLPFDSDDAHEQELWKTLRAFRAADPPASLRSGFYRKLDAAKRPGIVAKLRELLGLSGNHGWLTANACILLGLGVGQLVGPDPGDSPDRLALLEHNVAVLNRTLILDRLDNDSAGKRLRGVLDAAYLVGEDAEITRALLQRATGDRVTSIRTAAIDALGPQVSAPSVAATIMDSILRADSPLVQLALIDLVLRHGNQDQINQLLALAEDGNLYPDLSRHVLTTLERDTV
jgi:hypothetical protein